MRGWAGGCAGGEAFPRRRGDGTVGGMGGPAAEERQHGPQLVGRAAELDELAVALGDAAEGRGGLFVLSGEPGIGKTVLADALAARARGEGALVVWGRCWEGGGAPAYWPWVQVIRACLRAGDPTELPASLGPTAEYGP